MGTIWLHRLVFPYLDASGSSGAEISLDRLHVHLFARALNHMQTDGTLQFHRGCVGHL